MKHPAPLRLAAVLALLVLGSCRGPSDRPASLRGDGERVRAAVTLFPPAVLGYRPHAVDCPGRPR